MRKTAVMGVRVVRADWDAFGSLCQSLGTNRNAALVAFIKTGEPIFKSGVGPRRGKKK